MNTYLFNHNNKFIIGVTYLTDTPNQISFDFAFNKKSYLFLFNKNDRKGHIIRKIVYGKENIRLPLPRYRVGSRYLGIFSLTSLQKLSMENLEKDKASYSALIQAKETYQNPVIVLYNFNFNKIPKP